MGQLRPLKQKVNIMRSLAIVLMLSAFSGVALAQFKCENHTLPDGTTCPVDDDTDHTYPDEDHCSRYWDCYNGCFTHMQCQLDYLYDITTGWCDEPEKVYCGDRDCDGRPCKDDPPVPCNFDCEANGGDGFTPTRITASNSLSAQTDKPFAEHAEKKMDNNCTMTHQKNGATGGTKLTVTSDQNVTKMIKIAKIPIILPLQNQPNVTVLNVITEMTFIQRVLVNNAFANVTPEFKMKFVVHLD